MQKNLKPKPISIRPKSQAVRDLYLAKGGAVWFNRVLLAELEAVAKKKGVK